MSTRALWWLTIVLGLLLLGAGSGAAVYFMAGGGAGSGGTLGPPRRVGPIGWVQLPNSEPMLWVLTQRDEQLGSWARRGAPSPTITHFDLHAHDPLTAERRWTRRLLTVRDGRPAPARFLGMEGSTVWLFLRDQPVALAANDGSVQGTAIDITAANPGLAPLWPTTARSFVFHQGLIVTTAEALRWRVDPKTWRAAAIQVPNDEAFRRSWFMSTEWNGLFRTEQFLTRQMITPDDRWVGLYSAREAAAAAQDTFGNYFKDPDSVLDEGPGARRTLWLASIGKTRAAAGGNDRLQKLAPVSGSAAFLQGGLVKRPGERAAFQPGADGGAIVIHRAGSEGAGADPLVMTRIQPDLQPRWRKPLPIAEIHSRWQMTDRLVFFGSRAVKAADGAARTDETLVSVELDSGNLRAWTIGAERSP